MRIAVPVTEITLKNVRDTYFELGWREILLKGLNNHLEYLVLQWNEQGEPVFPDHSQHWVLE